MDAARTTPPETAVTECPGCRLEMPPGRGLYDGYYHVTPECWSVYLEVLEREFSNMVLFGRVHQLTVDTYAAQHAGGAHKAKSVCVHLVGLCVVVEHGVPPSRAARHLQWVAQHAAPYPEFEPPRTTGSSTVLDVALADGPREHEERVRAWATEVWESWGHMHDTIRGLAEASLVGVR